MDTFNNLSIDKRERILQASLEEFGRFGYSNASTNRIVKTIGISKGSLFKYFSTKLDLYKYLVELVTNDLLDFLDFNHIKDLNWEAVIIYYAEKEFEYLVTHPRLYKFFKRIVLDLDLVELKSIKNFLTSKSLTAYSQLVEAMNLEIDLTNHIMFVLKGYNEYFFKLNDGSFTQNLQPEYTLGLKKHLSYINI